MTFPATLLSSSGGTFPGFGEDAPLELGMGTGDTSMLSRLLDGSHDSFAVALASAGNCVRPIQLTGSSLAVDTSTGEILSSYASAQAPLGTVFTKCGNRREHMCPACSRTYARDTFEMIRAGVVGGKTVPATVAKNPLLFVTLTAPSFGYVHGVRADGGRCRPRSSDRVEVCKHGVRLSCGDRHDQDDELVGAPLCWDCYDWASAVVWQWHAPELWRRTTIALRRALAAELGVSSTGLKKVASLQYAKVAEYQARGMVHFHALIRLDGPDGPGSPAPDDADMLAEAVSSSVASVVVEAPPAWETDSARVLRWGAQVDVRTITHGPDQLRASQALSPAQVAGYLAKYATKDATSGGVSARPHARRMRWWCQRLGEAARERDTWRRAGWDTVVPVDPKTNWDYYALMGKWAKMLGFRGHFSTKSRRYALTLGRLRRARARFQRLAAAAQRDGVSLDTRDLEARLLADDADEDTTLVVGDWRYSGTGWPRSGDAVLAAAAAARAREYDQWEAERKKISRKVREV